MKLEKAIEILALDVKGDAKIDYQDWLNALKLGIEALKRELHKRQTMSLNKEDLLPGETED